MKQILFFLLCLGFADSSLAANSQYDCSGFKPFKPIDALKADVTISKLNKYVPGQGNSPVAENDQMICESKKPVVIPVKDIRGREADWYYCDKPAPENYLICETEYKARSAKLIVVPHMVIRHWKPQDALDTNMHMNLIPEGDDSRALDTFTQSLGFDLSQREIILNGSSGGRGSHSDQDAYYVRVHFHK